MSCFLPRKIASKKHTSLSHTPSFTRNFVTHIHIHTFIHTYLHTYIRTYVHTDIHTYVHAYYLFTYFHTQSFTTSFVFPSFSDPATTFETHYWKKLTCGVIRSFNLVFYIRAFNLLYGPPSKTNVWQYFNCVIKGNLMDVEIGKVVFLLLRF